MDERQDDMEQAPADARVERYAPKKAKHQRHPDDYYCTPAWCVTGLYETLEMPKPTLDPCAGTGALVRAAPQSDMLIGVEIHEGRAEEAGAGVIQGDGLDLSWEGQHVLMNPPFKDALTWVKKGVAEPLTCAALLKMSFLATKGRYDFWAEYPPTAVVVMSGRPSFTGNGSDNAEYMWCYWDNRVPRSNDVRMHWILSPGRKGK